MWGGCLGDRVLDTRGYEKLLTGDADVQTSVIGICLGDVGLQPRTVAVKILALPSRPGEFLRIEYFNDFDGR